MALVPKLLAQTVLAATLVALVDCKTSLPRSQTHVSEFTSFAQARDAIEALQARYQHLESLR
ncbi:MAG: hypothetical protein IPH35_26610 [Rhodoferax sp.]|nr:hypothetical protein [Rhodoferax sp.]